MSSADVLTPRAARVVRYQNVALLVISIIFPAVLGYYMNAIHIQRGLWWGLFLLCTYAGVRLLHHGAVFLIVLGVYKNNMDAMQQDMQSMDAFVNDGSLRPALSVFNTHQTDVIIHDMGAQIGVYKDTAIYDWLSFQYPNGAIVKTVFDGTMDTDKGGFVVPEDVYLLEPGILYKAVLPG